MKREKARLKEKDYRKRRRTFLLRVSLARLRLLDVFFFFGKSNTCRHFFAAHKNDDRNETKKTKNARNEKRVRAIDKFHADEMLPN